MKPTFKTKITHAGLILLVAAVCKRVGLLDLINLTPNGRQESTATSANIN